MPVARSVNRQPNPADGNLRDVQIAARHADPRTAMRYDRARKNLDRRPNYILAAYMASGT
jgi:integrase/recombinase XerD